SEPARSLSGDGGRHGGGRVHGDLRWGGAGDSLRTVDRRRRTPARSRGACWGAHGRGREDFGQGWGGRGVYGCRCERGGWAIRGACFADRAGPRRRVRPGVREPGTTYLEGRARRVGAVRGHTRVAGATGRCGARFSRLG